MTMLDPAPVDEYALQDPASAAWTAAQPRKGIGRELTVQQELACALRILAKAGWQENVSGHITWAQPGTVNLWCNPWGIWWEETTASDIVLVSPDGEVLEGRWGATGAVYIHTELHRVRPDATVVVHGHPFHVTLLAGLGVTPPFIHQNSCIFDGDLAFVDEYAGFVSNADAGVYLAEQVGTATAVVLANHGGLVTGRTIGEACYHAVTFERMCKLAYEAMLTGVEPRPIDPAMRAAMKPGLKLGCPPTFWDGAVRQLLRDEPEVLD
jgi:ribulose-5-phosphate 4-epimerase/fuculose-1-phosphate aldolase